MKLGESIIAVDRLGEKPGTRIITIRCQHANHGGITFRENAKDLDFYLEYYRKYGCVPLVEGGTL